MVRYNTAHQTFLPRTCGRARHTVRFLSYTEIAQGRQPYINTVHLFVHHPSVRGTECSATKDLFFLWEVYTRNKNGMSISRVASYPIRIALSRLMIDGRSYELWVNYLKSCNADMRSLAIKRSLLLSDDGVFSEASKGTR